MKIFSETYADLSFDEEIRVSAAKSLTIFGFVLRNFCGIDGSITPKSFFYTLVSRSSSASIGGFYIL